MLTCMEKSLTLTAEQESVLMTMETHSVVVIYEVVPEITKVYQGFVNDEQLETLKRNCGTYGNCHDTHEYEAVQKILESLKEFEVNEYWNGSQINGWLFVTGQLL